MKFVWCLILIAGILLTGCTQPALETVNDAYVTQPPAEMRQVHLELPQDAAQAVMEVAEGAKLYLCDGYELRLQTLDNRDLDAVLRAVTGYGEDRLTVIKTRDGALDRYDCAWCSAGEEGEVVGRTAILDDGNYFYCVSALADSGSAFACGPVWQEILDSFTLG